MDIKNRRRPPGHWPELLWRTLDGAVADEMRAVGVARRHLPIRGVADEARTIPSQGIVERAEPEGSLTDGEAAAGPALAIDEAPVTPLLEIWTEFVLTRQQAQREEEFGTALTLARRGANLLAQAEDALVLRGTEASDDVPLLASGLVRRRRGPSKVGLLSAPLATAEPLAVPELEPGSGRYGEETYGAVAAGYRRLQGARHRGPFVLVLPPAPFADTQKALPSLLRPAERIQSLLATPIAATGDLPPASGLLLSTGGDTLELVIGRPPEVAFLFEDEAGFCRFRVWERFALRVKDPTAIVPLQFQTTPGAEASTTP
ncbi:MAG: family 1 encapsulin nanocompartment shell protein [Acidobacteriota bacterium]